jgi:hypothetical protein
LRFTFTFLRVSFTILRVAFLLFAFSILRVTVLRVTVLRVAVVRLFLFRRLFLVSPVPLDLATALGLFLRASAGPVGARLSGHHLLNEIIHVSIPSVRRVERGAVAYVSSRRVSSMRLAITFTRFDVIFSPVSCAPTRREPSW